VDSKSIWISKHKPVSNAIVSAYHVEIPLKYVLLAKMGISSIHKSISAWRSGKLYSLQWDNCNSHNKMNSCYLNRTAITPASNVSIEHTKVAWNAQATESEIVLWLKPGMEEICSGQVLVIVQGINSIPWRNTATLRIPGVFKEWRIGCSWVL